MENNKLPVYEFDGFRLDCERKSLWYADDVVSLTPKSLETLIVLVRNRRQVVEKDTIFDEVWPDTFVEETTLAQNIRTLRKTLARFQSGKEFIVTVPRRGYRFVGEVHEFVDDDEIFVVERRTRTHIVANQKTICDSEDTLVTEPSTARKAAARRRKFLTGLSAVILLIAAFAGYRFLFSAEKLVLTSFQRFRADVLVADSGIGHAAVSPNGKFLVHTVQTPEGQSLILRPIEGGNPLTLVEKLSGAFIGVAFSPDSERILYAVYENAEPGNPRIGGLYEIPMLGGAPRQILRDIDGAPAVSSDKTHVAFIRRDPQTKETALIVAGLADRSERKLAVRPFAEGFTATGVAWSPDGRFISTTVATGGETGRFFRINVVDSNSGAQQTVGDADWSWAGQTVWLKDGSGIAVVAYGAKSPNANDEIWLVSFPDGKSRLLSNGVNGIFGISMSADSASLVAVKSNKITNFTIADAVEPSSSQRILTKMGDDSLLPLGADWTPEGEILFSATQSGNPDIWKIDAESGKQIQLTSDDSRETLPRISRDGRTLIFLSNRSGRMNVWRANADGTAPKQITDAEDVADVVLSPDGLAVFYLAPAADAGQYVLWRQNIDGGEARQLTTHQTFSPRISPDGKQIAAFYRDPQTKRMTTALFDAAEGTLIRYLETPRTDAVPIMEWTTDGNALFMILKQNGKTAIWKQPVGGGTASKMNEWTNESVFRLAVSKDGAKLFLETGIETNSVVVFKALGPSE